MSDPTQPVSETAFGPGPDWYWTGGCNSVFVG